MIVNQFRFRLIEKMQEQNITQKKLADLMNTTQQTISNWVNGIHEPCFNDLLKLCEFFKEDANFFLGFGF